MLIVSVAFIVCWLPNNAFFLIVAYSVQTATLVVGYYPTVFLAYLNVCLNPFIYALKHEGVRSQLSLMIVCCKQTQAEASGRSGTAVRTRETRTGLTQRK